MIPAQWLPSLPPPANGWLPVRYELSEESGILRYGEYRVDGDGSGLAMTRESA